MLCPCWLFKTPISLLLSIYEGMLELYYQIQDKIQFEHLVNIVRDWLVGPGDRALEGFHRSDVHPHPDVHQVSPTHSKVKRAKGFRGHDPCAILKIVK